MMRKIFHLEVSIIFAICPLSRLDDIFKSTALQYRLLDQHINYHWCYSRSHPNLLFLNQMARFSLFSCSKITLRALVFSWLHRTQDEFNPEIYYQYSKVPPSLISQDLLRFGYSTTLSNIISKLTSSGKRKSSLCCCTNIRVLNGSTIRCNSVL